MREKIADFIKKYHINTWKIILFTLILLVFVLRFLVQESLILKPIGLIFNLYADFLIAQSKLLLSFSNSHFVFDYIKNQIISNGHELNINRFYFSINQIVAAFFIVVITKSPIVNKIITFTVAFLILSVYNAIRISLHAIYPETVSIHNWFFNLVLIPRWLIVLGFAWYYFKKYPFAMGFVKIKFGLSDKFIKNTFIKIAIIIILYYFVVIFIFNDIIFINGSLMISFILNVSKYFIELIGYDCWINNRLIYGTKASLFMDDACMGIDLMFLFASFIALMPGLLKHKLWYIPLGLVVILLLNCLRVILIFINMSKTGAYTIALEIHDLYTYPVLVFTFFMWMIWINRFFKPKTLPKIKDS